MAAGCAIGVDLGGTKLLAGAVDATLEVQHRSYRLIDRADGAAVLDALLDAVSEAREATSGEVVAVGMGVPCLVEPRRGVALGCNHLPFVDLPLRDLLAERIGLPVAVDNDANVALLAEWRQGAAKGARNALMLTIGTGIGGAIVAEGAIVRGAHGSAGELGHIVIDPDGPPCPGNCPNHGCLESLASGIAIGREGARVARGSGDSELARAVAAGREITGALVTELAHDGDAAARDVLALVGGRLGLGIASMVNVFDPEVVVVGGGAIAAGELLLAPARDVVLRRALAPARQAPIVPARFGTESGMLGAALLAFELVGTPIGA